MCVIPVPFRKYLMVRYHFNIRDGRYVPDVDGTLMPTLEHAHREAVRLAGYLLMTEPGEFWNGGEWFVEVTLNDGTLLFRVKFQAENLALAGNTPYLRPNDDE